MDKKQVSSKRFIIIPILTAVMMWVLLYAPTAYVVYEPGIAVPVKPMITIESGGSPSQGEFLLTAIRLTQPNLWGIIQSVIDPDRDVYKKRDVFRGYSDEQYANRLTVIMQGSQNDAIEAAYRYAGLPYEIKASIMIAEVPTIDSRTDGPFRAGDRLVGLSGGERFDGVEDAIGKLQNISSAATVSFDVERDGKHQTVELSIAPIEEGTALTAQTLAPLLGITSITELRSLVPGDERNRIAIAAGEIGGPSAGLVFALQALDLLDERDLTAGARIAATGTIQADGKVGAIGGIKQKVVIASEQGAQLFIVPKPNEKEAKAKRKTMKASMDIIGVDSLEEAMDAIAAYTS